MVMWFNHHIVVGRCLVMDMDTLLFKPLLLRVLIINFPIVSLIFCHSALHMLIGHSFILYTSQVESMSSDLSCLIFSESTLKFHQFHAPSLRILLSVIFTFPLRERSERVGLS